MPQDSTYILNEIADTAQLPDSVRQAFREASQDHGSSGTIIQPYSRQAQDNGIPWGTINFFIIAASLFLFLKYWRYRFLTKKISRIFEEKKQAYHDILWSYNPYYKSL